MIIEEGIVNVEGHSFRYEIKKNRRGLFKYVPYVEFEKDEFKWALNVSMFLFYAKRQIKELAKDLIYKYEITALTGESK